MHPLVKAAAAVAVLSALGSLDRGPRVPPPAVVPPAQARGVNGMAALCPAGTLPEGPMCLPLPQDEAPAGPDLAPGRPARTSAEIPRRPDRPADPAQYLYPLGSAEHPPRIARGFGKDRDEPGIVLAARPGEPVRAVTLDQQEGEAELIFAGERPGQGLTAVTSHLVREGGQLRAYLLFYGNLDHLAPDLAVGAPIEPGATLGAAAIHRASQGIAEITLEARQLREGEKVEGLDAARLFGPTFGVPVDLRNLLPLREPAP
ncbi:MAG: hypothetical protein U0359_20440 [Byssovorax sp.]